MNTNGKYENINTNRKYDIGKKKDLELTLQQARE